MSRYTKKMQKKAHKILLAGEKLLAAARVVPLDNGGLAAMAARAASSHMRAEAGHISTSEPQVNPSDHSGATLAESFPRAQMMVLGITSRRLMVWKRSALTGGPQKKPLGDVPLGDIVEFTSSTSGVIHRIHLVLRDGSTIDFDVAKLDGAPVLQNAWDTVRATRGAA